MATQVAEQAAEQTGTAVVPVSPQREGYAIMKDKARNFAMSALLPEAIRGNSYDQAFANCLIALQMAEAMGEMPLVVMQNIHIVKGKAGFAAQYMIARANASGIFRGRINWRVDKSEEKNLSVTAYATLADTGEVVEFTVDMAMAAAEGWTSNSKYKTMPEVMLRYRSATFLVRFYAPDVMLGYRTSDEYEDVAAVIAGTPAAPALTAEMLTDQSAPAVVDAEADDDHTDAAAELALDDQGDWRKKANEFLGGIRNAKRASYLASVEQQYRAVMSDMPRELADEVEEALGAKKAEIGEGA